MIKTLLFLVLLLCSSSIYAFDGQREGFVLGIGVGGGLVEPQETPSAESSFATIMSGTIAYGINDFLQVGVGKKVLIFDYNNSDVYQELGGLVVDVIFDEYYLTWGAGISGATNTVSLDDVLLGDASFIGLGYEFDDGLFLEVVTGKATFNTAGSSVVTPIDERFYGVLLTTYFY